MKLGTEKWPQFKNILIKAFTEEKRAQNISQIKITF